MKKLTENKNGQAREKNTQQQQQQQQHESVESVLTIEVSLLWEGFVKGRF